MDNPAIISNPEAGQENQREETTETIKLPSGVMDGAKDGDPFEGLLSGKIVDVDGELRIYPEAIEGQPIESEQSEPEAPLEDQITTALKKQPRMYGNA